MSNYKESIEYLQAMKEQGNTILGVSHDHIPKYFPMEYQDEDSRLSFGLKGIAAGAITGGIAGKAMQASKFGEPGRDVFAITLGAGLGATAGLARNLIEYGKRKNGREKKEKK